MFADSSGPCFNPQKTQLSFLKLLLLIVFFLFDQPLSFAETVVILSNLISLMMMISFVNKISVEDWTSYDSI